MLQQSPTAVCMRSAALHSARLLIDTRILCSTESARRPRDDISSSRVPIQTYTQNTRRLVVERHLLNNILYIYICVVRAQQIAGCGLSATDSYAEDVDGDGLGRHRALDKIRDQRRERAIATRSHILNSAYPNCE